MVDPGSSGAGKASSPRRLRVSQEHLRDLDSCAVQAYPEECCGVLLGRLGEVLEVRPVANAHDGPRSRRYTLDPRELLSAHKAAREADLEVIGYYHSHPDGSAMPSDADLATALPDVSYLILGVTSERVTERRSWRLSGRARRFVEEGID